MKSLYPLRGLPDQRQLWSWISYDVANQSFTLIINTLLFSIFFSKVVVRDDAIDDRVWALTYGVSMLLTAALSPIVGAMADQRRWKKAGLLTTGFICGILTCALAFIQPGQIWLAVAIYIPANLCFSLGENYLAAFLPHLAKPNELGRVSGFSWACAYSAAFLLLVITAAAMILLKLKNPEQWRPFFVFAGLWFLALSIPTLLGLREPSAAASREPGNLIAVAFRRLGTSIRETARFRDLALLMLASLFYGTGMSVVVFFASKLAAEYGFGQEQLVIFVGVITISGILGTALPTVLQDRIGHRLSTVILLVIWIASVAVFASYAYLRAHAPDPANYANWPMWLVGNLLGFGLGSLGTANRAFVGYLTPASRSAEVFGVWGLVFKLAAVLTFPFAWAKDTLGTPAALLVLIGFMVVGLLLTLMVNERRGAAAAREADAAAEGVGPAGATGTTLA